LASASIKGVKFAEEIRATNKLIFPLSSYKNLSPTLSVVHLLHRLYGAGTFQRRIFQNGALYIVQLLIIYLTSSIMCCWRAVPRR